MLVSLIAAGVLRLYYARWDVTDFWGDAYHHWLVSHQTLQNAWSYTDYKGLETVWLPAYHYLVAAAMALSGRSDLVPAHLTNLVLGVLACGLAAGLVVRITKDGWAGLGAGLTLALLPWHIAYSYMNMPEVLAGVLLMLALLAGLRDRAGPLAVVAFASGLTRHELTLLMVPVALWLVARGRPRAAAGVAVGLAAAVGLWSSWSLYRVGDPTAWWRQYQEATAWEGRFWTDTGVRVANLTAPMGSALSACPPLWVFGLAVVGAVLHKRWRRRVRSEGWLLIGLVGVHWMALGVGFWAGHLPVADPRYVLTTLPVLVSVGAIVISAAPRRKWRAGLYGLSCVVLVFSLTSQLGTFSDKSYVLAPERAAGEFLGRRATDTGSFWVDAPVAVYFSQLEPGRFLSSYQILLSQGPSAGSRAAGADRALAAVRDHDVRYVLWERVPYTAVPEVWPEMATGRPFEQAGYRFEPVFRYEGWELEYGARPTVLWRVESLPR